MRRFSSILKDEQAATAVEYGLILAMIFLAMCGALGLVATETIDMWTTVSDQVSNSR